MSPPTRPCDECPCRPTVHLARDPPRVRSSTCPCTGRHRSGAGGRRATRGRSIVPRFQGPFPVAWSRRDRGPVGVGRPSQEHGGISGLGIPGQGARDPSHPRRGASGPSRGATRTGSGGGGAVGSGGSQTILGSRPIPWPSETGYAWSNPRAGGEPCADHGRWVPPSRPWGTVSGRECRRLPCDGISRSPDASSVTHRDGAGIPGDADPTGLGQHAAVTQRLAADARGAGREPHDDIAGRGGIRRPGQLPRTLARSTG